MKNEIIQSLTNNFESYANKTDNGVEFWLARDLQQLLGYDKWDNFLGVISRVKIACETTGHKVSDHFADAGKMVKLGSGSEHEIERGKRKRAIGLTVDAPFRYCMYSV